MGRKVLVAVLILIGSHSAIGQSYRPSSTAFRWLNSREDATLRERIKMAFSEELKPDDPEKVKPTVAEKYKWVSRVGVFETSALVLIGERETRTSTYGEYFVAFNYDLESGEKTSLTSPNSGYMEWKFETVVRFDSSSTPDLVFTYPSCIECEADYLLSSFRFNSAKAKWEVRTWSDKNTGILVGSDYSVGTDQDSRDDCLFKFVDFNGDGFEDLAVRCLVITREGKILDDITTLYTVQHGRPQVLAVTDPRQLAAIRRRLCVSAKKSKLCPSN